MEFLLIGEAKLKIILDSEDMRKYRLEPGAEQGTSTRKALWRVLDVAKSEVGFDPAGDKVLVQFYPIKGGGCEVFVTKLGILPAASARLVSKSERISMLSRKKGTYLFSELDAMIRASKAIRRITGEEAPRSDAYYTDRGSFVLVIEEYGRGGEPTEFPCIQEFGRLMPADLSGYIPEHCRSIVIGNAVEKLSELITR